MKLMQPLKNRQPAVGAHIQHLAGWGIDIDQRLTGFSSEAGTARLLPSRRTIAAAPGSGGNSTWTWASLFRLHGTARRIGNENQRQALAARDRLAATAR